ncbi:Ig-like domain-containing protein [Pseudonocardia charpentierae]|uniref:Ig-like domain-containing protein n=1 Tax=Pseudonocardia charpentierae TaxID=3075545 RepID=A0ABU2NCT3_9PSEU|nr:Ig-like domain-containing protein [Pseudonocardia sp. DSM 45834]MDT0351679.1 Ig-like domain-containing protein [Pseudonocardia sp. DSM 45834]
MPRDLSARVPSRLAAVVALVVVGLAAVSVGSTPAHAQGSVYYVNPDTKVGNNANTGTSSGAPFATLQKALDVAQAGATINLAAGTYREAVITKRAGTAAAPITVKGPQEGRDKAVLYGLGGRVFSIDHSYYTLTGFTIDGQQNIARSEYPNVSSLSQIEAFKNSVQAKAVNSKLVYVGASTTSADIVGTTISNMFLNGSGGECVRFRNRAANSLIVDSVIQWCGMRASGSGDQYKYHNAEGVYIGTSPKSTDQPFAANDTSNNIVVSNSTINTYGSECFEVKENANRNRLENSDCGWNDEPLANQGSNVELRGDHNTVLGSRLSQSRSWNLKLASDSTTYDKGGNTAQGTTFSSAATYPIINKQTGSGPFCGNTFPSGTIADPSGKAVSSPATCTGSTAPTVTARTPAANATGIAPTDNVTATFSEAVQGVSATTFTLKPSTPVTAAAVAATFKYDSASRTATLDPSADLAANMQYTATLTGGASGIKSATGTPLATATWNFTTAPGSAAPAPPVDTAAPTVATRTPAANATGFGIGDNVTATFSEPVTGVRGTVTGGPAATFSLKNATTGAAIAASVGYDAATRKATLDPTSNLAANTRFTATLTGGTTGIKDMANNPLATGSWTFTTGAAPDTIAPTVTARTPSANATGVSRTRDITATFSEGVAGVGGTSVTLKNAFTGAVIAAGVSYSASTRVVTLNPSSTLAANTKFTVTLTGGAGAIKDAAGNPLTTVSWTFTTSR